MYIVAHPAESVKETLHFFYNSLHFCYVYMDPAQFIYTLYTIVTGLSMFPSNFGP